MVSDIGPHAGIADATVLALRTVLLDDRDSIDQHIKTTRAALFEEQKLQLVILAHVQPAQRDVDRCRIG